MKRAKGEDKARTRAAICLAVAASATGCAAEHFVGSPGLLPAGALPIGVPAATVQLGDLDGDGHTDVALSAAAAPAQSQVCILRGSGALELGATSCVPLGTTAPATALLFADLRLRGHPDLIAATDRLTVLEDGLRIAGSVPLRGSVAALAAADLSADGYPDVVAADSSRALITLWLAAGAAPSVPLLSENASYEVGPGPLAALAVDLDGNGTTELVAMSRGDASHPSSLRVLGRRGAATFVGCPADKKSPQPGQPVGLGTLDPDGSGRRHLAWIDAAAHEVQMIATLDADPATGRMQLACTPTARWPLPAEAGPAVLALVGAELSGDGRPDVLVAHAPRGAEASVSVLLGEEGGLHLATQLAAGSGVPGGLALGDLDGDGRPELVVLQAQSRALHLFHNRFE